MGFLDSVKRALRLIKLDGNAAIEIASETSSTIYGSIIILVAGLLSTSLVFILTPPFDVQAFSVQLIENLGEIIIMILVFHGLAKIFRGQASLVEYFRAQSHISIIFIVFNIIELPIFFAKLPIIIFTIIGYLVYLWGLIMSIVVLKSVHKLSTGKSILVALVIPLVILLILILIGAAAYFGVLNPDQFLPVK